MRRPGLRRAGSGPGLPSAGWHQRSSGQALVEFALTFPIFLLWLLVSIQLSLVAVQYYSLIRVTNETARWAAVRPDTVDAVVLGHARANALSLDPNRITTLTTSPACAVLTNSRCAGRYPGSVLAVTIQYDVSNLIFLPTTYGYSGVTVTLPSSIPPYTVRVMVE